MSHALRRARLTVGSRPRAPRPHGPRARHSTGLRRRTDEALTGWTCVRLPEMPIAGQMYRRRRRPGMLRQPAGEHDAATMAICRSSYVIDITAASGQVAEHLIESLEVDRLER